jgi:SAM-dependent methyltransferase
MKTKMAVPRFLVLFFIAAAIVAVAGCSRSPTGSESGNKTTSAGQASDAGVKRDAPYQWTELDVAVQMLKMAGVTKHDVVYDLGCGDGRIPIAAAELFGARGVGIEIDPKLVAESKENAQRAGVADRVQFYVQDIFVADVSSATVVALYLGSEVNLRLRPKLLRELKPGTRLVSNDFDMGDWVADKTSVIDRNRIYYWVVPADVSGTWRWTMRDPKGSGSEEFVMQLKQRFQKVEGSISVAVETTPLTGPSLAGSYLRFSMNREVGGKPATTHFEAAVTGHVMEGTTRSQGAEGGASWKATRDPSTRLPLSGG